MNAKTIGVGTTAVLVLIYFLVAVGPRYTDPEGYAPADTHRSRTALEDEGRKLYIAYGCQYCHSQYLRQGDWGLGAERIAEAGDYAGDYAPQLGSSRNGPDLSQEGGEHSDDWHFAHFYNPRWTRPESIMPPFDYLRPEETKALTAYVQSLGHKLADERVARQWKWRKEAIAAYEAGVDENVEWLHANVPEGWLRVPNPYPITPVSFKRGETIYQRHCIGCHGPVGDGQGPAAAFIYPPPLNFTTLRRHGIEGGATGGMLYYQIMNGITGTAMPYFKRELESEKIWDVSNYVAKQFIGVVDANAEPKGIDAAFEPVEPAPAPPAL
ncbi:MAG: cytochrome-c oxidase [Myxococcales bacterium]|nr:MAG: cytochrome-c oxidase [Myxococcales bacterium]